MVERHQVERHHGCHLFRWVLQVAPLRWLDIFKSYVVTGVLLTSSESEYE